jgi:hypothetical protein
MKNCSIVDYDMHIVESDQMKRKYLLIIQKLFLNLEILQHFEELYWKKMCPDDC